MLTVEPMTDPFTGGLLITISRWGSNNVPFITVSFLKMLSIPPVPGKLKVRRSEVTPPDKTILVEERMNFAVGDVTLITKTSVELPTSVRVDFTRLIEFTQITLSGPVLVMVVLPVMSPNIWVHGSPASVAERARASALSWLRF